ncbi:DUF4301 family protein [Pseudodesulfovibrio sp. JC047]|uniref:DUF4301 family protein n=1 Tax=Pseudodesulfovibrio sp. JC047 TaxID=2683199 RepID=UPI0013D49174|nr:DUF4301 family protein [Pseudodesulfovibrio sp. JC047]NDV19252.1 DUF4301 family protein [Pseudodesulfovibrio sp. JC047]
MSNASEKSVEQHEAILHEAEKVLQQIIDSGVAEETIVEQMHRFRAGFPYTRLLRPCTPGDGIMHVSAEERTRLIHVFRQVVADGRVTKFVPASGAATRMFKSLLALFNREDPTLDLDKDDGDSVFGREFFASLDAFAFYDELIRVMAADGLDLNQCLEAKEYRTILEYVLTEKGLKYGQLPKGLIAFHAYPDAPRTPFGEHIAEAVAYATDVNGVARVHFTVSPEHRQTIETHVAEVMQGYPEVRFDVTYSEQRKQTNTIAVDLSNDGFRTQEGRLLFRPAGHGALLFNLNELQGDVVFLKNIDNVAPDRLKKETIEYKQVLGGLLVEFQSLVFDCVRLLRITVPDAEVLGAITKFAVSRLSLSLPDDFSSMIDADKAEYLLAFLNRPIRVCGMVKNQGEPGGGPFWVPGPNNGVATPQIVEKSQVDLDDETQAECLASATHFNPVDIVCGVRDCDGNPFDLMECIDQDTGFISLKSKEGQELKAMELPGLWNGSMADWITVFVEVPLGTFSPVKTVNDLLRPEHQS